MTVQRSSFVAAALLAAVIGAFWFLVLAPKRATMATIGDQIAQTETRRVAAERNAATAGQVRAAYERDYANLARLGKAAPPDDDVASLIYQLDTLARAHGVDFRALKLASAGAAAAPASTPASGDASGKQAAAKDATTKDATTKDPTAATPTPPAISQAPPGAVVGTAGLVTLPFTFTFDGGYLPMQRMLGAIDRLADSDGGAIAVRGRLITVDGFSLSSSRFGFPKVEALVSATAYIVPETEGLLAGATPQGPAAAQPASASGDRPSATATASIDGVG
jgi:hypothetical protein